MLYKKLLFLFLVVSLTRVMAQSPLNSPLGNFRKVEVKNQEFLFQTDNGRARVIVYSPDVIRISVEKTDFKKTFSYAVVVQPQKCAVRPNETGDVYTITTDSLVLKVTKRPLRFAFYTINGKLLNTDDPSFGTSWLGDDVTTYKSLQKDERFLGLGEQTGNIDRSGEAYINYNTDDPGYDNRSKSLYSSIPFYIGLHDSLCYGIFLDNTSRTTFNFGAGNDRFSYFTAEAGEMDYYFIYHQNIRSILESYTWLTGHTPLPPKWSLGYQQCRYSYFPDADVISTAQKFRERQIPIDMIYLDIHYMDEFKLFTWDKQRFPNPDQTIGQLNKMNLHLAVIIDPGVKVEKGYPVYDDGLKNDIFIKYPDGTNYQGQVWPGWCNFPDFTMPKARDWWGKWVKTYADRGITGYWNDMNEIATWGKEVPKLLELNWEGKKTSYAEAKNVYGMQMARSSYEGARKNMNGQRPFVLTRSGFAGLQRYTAIWTGDNQANDDHMLLGVRLLSSLGLSGVSFTGMDIGGFSGNPTTDLYIRWMQLGTFTPMFRGHTAIYTRRSEPWDYGEIAEDIAKRFIGFRYQLMPYLYSSFYESSQDGMPVLRSLAIQYPFDSKIYDRDFQQEFLFGSSVLVCPVRSTERLAKVYLPEGKWFDLYSDSVIAGSHEILTEAPIEKIPLFVKGGSIIPLQALTESTAENPGDTLFVHVYAGDHGSNFRYYEDDGTSYNYEKGNYYTRNIIFDPAGKSIRLEKKDGSLASQFKTVSLILHGFDNVQNLTVNGSGQNLQDKQVRFFVSRFAFADFGPKDWKKVRIVSFANSDNEIKINW